MRAIWLLNGFQVQQSGGIGVVPTSWSIAGTADFNGDGRGDILWRNIDGTVAIWLMNGATGAAERRPWPNSSKLVDRRYSRSRRRWQGRYSLARYQRQLGYLAYERATGAGRSDARRRIHCLVDRRHRGFRRQWQVGHPLARQQWKF